MAEHTRKRQKPVKHVPQRTCIGCRRLAGKRGLLRIVRTEQGVVVDPTGKLAGRGAYIHPTKSCWEIVLAGNRISQALRTSLSPENRAELRHYGESLPLDDASDGDAV